MSDLAAALDIVGARWALLIVERLLDGPQRYGDLQGDLGVPTNVLATRLRELEAAGVLTRLPLRHNTRAYALTDLWSCAVVAPRHGGSTLGMVHAHVSLRWHPRICLVEGGNARRDLPRKGV